MMLLSLFCWPQNCKQNKNILSEINKVGNMHMIKFTYNVITILQKKLRLLFFKQHNTTKHKEEAIKHNSYMCRVKGFYT